MMNMMNMFNINPELLSEKPTHRFNGNLVKVFKSTIMETNKGLLATAEILDGPNKGKWTCFMISDAQEIEVQS